MARINVEESWWADARRGKLARLLKDEALADGCMMKAWRTAQEFWVKNQGPIPEAVWFCLVGAAEILESSLAEKTEGGIYVKGSSEAFQWHEKLIERSREGGRKSAQVRLKKYGTTIPSGAKNTPKSTEPPPKRLRTATEPPPNRTEASLSLSLSLSKNLNTKETKGIVPSDDAKGVSTETVGNVPALVATYVKAYQARYGENVRPDVSPKVCGQMKRLLEYTTLDRARALIQVYCQMREPWFEKKAHDFSTFVENISKIGLALDRGEEVSHSPINWENLEREVSL